MAVARGAHPVPGSHLSTTRSPVSSLGAVALLAVATGGRAISRLLAVARTAVSLLLLAVPSIVALGSIAAACLVSALATVRLLLAVPTSTSVPTWRGRGSGAWRGSTTLEAVSAGGKVVSTALPAQPVSRSHVRHRGPSLRFVRIRVRRVALKAS